MQCPRGLHSSERPLEERDVDRLTMNCDAFQFGGPQRVLSMIWQIVLYKRMPRRISVRVPVYYDVFSGMARLEFTSKTY